MLKARSKSVAMQFPKHDSLKPLGPAICVSMLAVLLLTGQTSGPSSEFHIYAGSTHAHTSYTWSHGDQFTKSDCSGIQVYAPVPSSDISTWTDGYVKSKTGCAG